MDDLSIGDESLLFGDDGIFYIPSGANNPEPETRQERTRAGFIEWFPA